MSNGYLKNVSGETHVSLCHEMASLETLIALSRRMSPKQFFKKYQLAFSEFEDVTFSRRAIHNCSDAGRTIVLGAARSHNIQSEIVQYVTSVDLAGTGKQSKYVVILTCAYTKDGMCIPVSLDRGRFKSPETKDIIISHWMVYNGVVVVESNNYQISLVHDMKAEEWRFKKFGIRNTMKIVASFTGSNKNDPNVGLPALADYLEGGRIVIPSGSTSTRYQMAPLIKELKIYPGATTDCVMALWINVAHASFKSSSVCKGNSDVSAIRTHPTMAKFNEAQKDGRIIDMIFAAQEMAVGKYSRSRRRAPYTTYPIYTGR
jgi:hypothetical protein